MATVSITVGAVNDAPTVVAAIGQVTVDENAANSTFDLSTVFGDIDSASLTYTVQNNTNPTLVTPSISGNTLTLSYQANQSGVATIILRANRPRRPVRRGYDFAHRHSGSDRRRDP